MIKRTLRNGVTIPSIGYGTAQPLVHFDSASMKEFHDIFVFALRVALEYGYKLIDTAQMYYNEAYIGEIIKQEIVPRKELFLTTKLHNDIGTCNETLQSFEESCKKLNTDYLDLFLIHWPNPIKHRNRWQERNAECWRAIEKLYEEKRIRAIGVSNFLSKHFDALMQIANVCPMVNQIRLYPGDASIHPPTLEWCRAHGIQIEGYSPLGLGGALKHPTLLKLADTYGKSPAQLCLKWSIQKGWIPLPKSNTPERIRENIDLEGLVIKPEDIDKMDCLPNVLANDRDPDTTWW